MSYYDDYEMPTVLIRKKKRKSKLSFEKPKKSVDEMVDEYGIGYENDTLDDVVSSIEEPLNFRPEKKKKFAGLKLTYDWRRKSLGIGFMFKEE